MNLFQDPPKSPKSAPRAPNEAILAHFELILNAARIPAGTSHLFPLWALPVCISDTSTIRRAPLGEGAPWGGPLGPPLGRWQPLRKRLKHFGPRTCGKTLFFENRRWRGVRGRRKTSRLPNTLTEGSTVFLKENCPPGSFE